MARKSARREPIYSGYARSSRLYRVVSLFRYSLFLDWKTLAVVENQEEPMREFFAVITENPVAAFFVAVFIVIALETLTANIAAIVSRWRHR